MNTVEILQAAKAKIADPANWTKGSYAKTSEGNATEGYSPDAACFCSLGAIEAVSQKEHLAAGWPRGAESMLNMAASEVGDCISIVTYNDRHTHEEVMAVWDKAIELAIAGEGAK